MAAVLPRWMMYATVVCCITLAVILGAAARTSIRTPIPTLEQLWNAKPGDAERERARVTSLRDPFTPLATLSCSERLANNERIVWENSDFMDLVDFSDNGTTLLLVPKVPHSFPIDLPNAQQDELRRLAAATCDALMIAANKVPSTTVPSCRMFVNHPQAVTVRQLHVHVEADAGSPVPVGD